MPDPEGGNGKMEPVPLRKAHHPPHLDAKTSFAATSQMSRMQEYIKDIPVLRARVVQAVTHLEALVAGLQAELDLARAARKSFEEAATEITARFDQEKDHGPQPAAAGPGNSAVAEPGR